MSLLSSCDAAAEIWLHQGRTVTARAVSLHLQGRFTELGAVVTGVSDHDFEFRIPALAGFRTGQNKTFPPVRSGTVHIDPQSHAVFVTAEVDFHWIPLMVSLGVFGLLSAGLEKELGLMPGLAIGVVIGAWITFGGYAIWRRTFRRWFETAVSDTPVVWSVGAV